MSYNHGALLRAQIAARLAAFERRCVDEAGLQAAAVALVVVVGTGTGAGGPGDDAATVLLTQRAGNLRRHAGQYALPGGRADPGETAVETALRELREELGIALGAGDVLGVLDDYPTRSGFCMTPVVVWGPQRPEIVADRHEVARVFRIPLVELAGPEVPTLRESDDPERPILSLPLATLGHPIHAPTAAPLYQFREVALFGRATRVAHFEQPAFARK